MDYNVYDKMESETEGRGMTLEMAFLAEAADNWNHDDSKFRPEYWIAEFDGSWGMGRTLNSAIVQLKKQFRSGRKPKYGQDEMRVSGSSAPIHVHQLGWVTRGLIVQFNV